MVHVTREGDRINISKMTDSHLLNTISFINRRSKEGVYSPIICGGDDDMDVHERTLYGSDAREALQFNKYTEEAIKRGLSWKI